MGVQLRQRRRGVQAKVGREGRVKMSVIGIERWFACGGSSVISCSASPRISAPKAAVHAQLRSAASRSAAAPPADGETAACEAPACCGGVHGRVARRQTASSSSDSCSEVPPTLARRQPTCMRSENEQSWALRTRRRWGQWCGWGVSTWVDVNDVRTRLRATSSATRRIEPSSPSPSGLAAASCGEAVVSSMTVSIHSKSLFGGGVIVGRRDSSKCGRQRQAAGGGRARHKRRGRFREGMTLTCTQEVRLDPPAAYRRARRPWSQGGARARAVVST